MSDNLYEIFCIRYATQARTRRENFLGLDAHDAGPMPLDFFVWVVRNEARTIVVDTGFDADLARARRREFFCTPSEEIGRASCRERVFLTV